MRHCWWDALINSLILFPIMVDENQWKWLSLHLKCRPAAGGFLSTGQREQPRRLFTGTNYKGIPWAGLSTLGYFLGPFSRFQSIEDGCTLAYLLGLCRNYLPIYTGVFSCDNLLKFLSTKGEGAVFRETTYRGTEIVSL